MQIYATALQRIFKVPLSRRTTYSVVLFIQRARRRRRGPQRKL